MAKGRTVRDIGYNFWSEFKHLFFTREGLIGDVDYSTLFTPTLPFTKAKQNQLQFYGVDAQIPLLLTILLGLQHAGAMFGGITACALQVAQLCNLETADQTYIVSATLIASGILTALQVFRFRVPYTNIYVGSGVISVIGLSFTTISVLQVAIPIMYGNGYCPTDSNGSELPCRPAYSATIGTGGICSLLAVAIGFVPPKYLHKVFPPIVTGPILLLIGAALTQGAVQNWGGGADCYSGDVLCNTQSPSTSHPWGSGQYIGLGFLVVVSIILADKFGPPILKSCSVVFGLLIGCIVAAACGYFAHDSIDQSPNGEFLWVRTFPLTLYGPLVLPMLAVHLINCCENLADVAATAEVSRVEEDEIDTRVQGGLLASALSSVFACLALLPTMVTFSQNAAVVSMTQMASKRGGYACAVWLILMGVIGKFSAAIVVIPKPVIGGMTAFLFTSVGVTGLAVISRSNFSRRDRLVLTISLVFGFASLLSPSWFSRIFTYKGSNNGLQGFIDAIVIFVETPYAISMLAGVIANLILPEQPDAPDSSDVEILPVNAPIEEFSPSKTPAEFEAPSA